MTGPQAEKDVWLHSLHVSLTSFSFFSSLSKKKSPSSLLLLVSWVWFCMGLFSWLLYINGNFQNKDASACYLFLRAGGHKCFLVLQNYILSSELFREILVRAMRWLRFGLTCPIGFRDLEVTCNIHCCFRCNFLKPKAQCVSVCVKSVSVFLIMARGCSSAQSTSLLNTLLILSVDEQQETDWVCVYVCVSRLTLILNEKMPTTCLHKALDLWAWSYRSWPQLRPGDPQQPTG